MVVRCVCCASEQQQGGSSGSGSGGEGASLSTASSRDTVAKVLLSLASLQRETTDLLLEQIPALQYNGTGDGDDAASADPQCQKVNFPKLILAQFQWTDFVMDLEHLAGKLIEVIDACEKDVQRDIISLLPEVCSVGVSKHEHLKLESV